MARRKGLIAQVALLGALAVLAFPGASSALQPTYVIELTSSGPSPAVLRMGVVSYLLFKNTDTVTHSIAFADGSCSGQVAPGGQFNCDSYPDGSYSTFGDGAGDYRYTVDGTTRAIVKLIPVPRVVTLTARRHGFVLGAGFQLHGTLAATFPGALETYGPRMPVMVFARPDRFRPWHRIAVVMAKPLSKPRWSNPYSVWHLWVRPRRHTTYVAVAKSQAAVWERAQSRFFGVYVRRG